MAKLEKTIYITSNVQCNLRCTYCYEDKSGHEEMDVEETKKKIKELLSTPEDCLYTIDFHGGEPFLVFDKIKELCEWTWHQNFPQEFIFFATTNGTLVHGEIKDWLHANKNRFIAGLSLDGTREMQNMNRSNSFDKIDIDFFAKTWPNQSVKMTISPRSIETLAEGIEFIHSKGFLDISANLAYMVNWDNPKYLKAYYRELTKLGEFYKAHPELKKSSIFTMHMSSLVSPSSRNRRWCGAGVEMKAYNIDGKAYPCHLFFENVCGKEKSQAWQDIDFSNPEEYIKGECRECPIYPTCPTCYGSNYIERGDIGLRDMNLCKMEKIRTLVIAKYHYDRIVNSNYDASQLPVAEQQERAVILMALEKIAPVLEQYQAEIDKIP